MSDDKYQTLAELRQALLEAVASQKLIEQKISRQRSELDTWQRRLEHDQVQGQGADAVEIGKRLSKIKLEIAQLETEKVSQNDVERQLKATIFKLENSVQNPDYPDLSKLSDPAKTITRMEKKILEGEAFAELSENKELKLAQQADANSIDAELARLKQELNDKDKN